MDDREPEICYKRSLRTLLKCYQCFGLVNFVYKKELNRVVTSPYRKPIFKLAIGYCGLFSLASTLTISGTLFVVYYNMKSSALIKSEEVLFSSRLIFQCFTASILCVTYLNHKGKFVGTINQLLVLFERIKKVTNDDSLFYPRKLRKFIVIRSMIFIMTGISLVNSDNALINIAGVLWFVHSYTLMELTFWSHFYGNLTLMCFYLKSNNLLSTLCVTTTSTRKVRKRIREVISISYQIHRVKADFNNAFAAFHFVSFLCMFGDITIVYDLLKIVVSTVLGKVQFSPIEIAFKLFRTTFGKYSTLQNVYLSSHVADELVYTEKMFRRKLLTLVRLNEFLTRDREQQREVELVLLHHNIQNVNTSSLGLFGVDRKLIFEFFTDIVVTYSIIIFQIFIADYVLASGTRLILMKKSLTQAFQYVLDGDDIVLQTNSTTN